MSRSIFLSLLCLSLFLPAHLIAGAPGDPDQAVKTTQIFYDGYMKALTSGGDTRAYVLSSTLVTAAFKKAYTAFMKNADSDPILGAQDYSDAGFTAGPAMLRGETATVTLSSRDPKFPHTIKVTLKPNADGIFLIAGTQDLKAK